MSALTRAELVKRLRDVAMHPNDFQSAVADMLEADEKEIEERDRWRDQCEDFRKRWSTAENALYHFKYPIQPDVLRSVADMVECDTAHCDSFWHEYDTNASGCSKYETGEECGWIVACELRQFAEALDTLSAARERKGETG
jgi:hypothetical protein